jgi:hypothetical protein
MRDLPYGVPQPTLSRVANAEAQIAICSVGFDPSLDPE